MDAPDEFNKLLVLAEIASKHDEVSKKLSEVQSSHESMYQRFPGHGPPRFDSYPTFPTEPCGEVRKRPSYLFEPEYNSHSIQLEQHRGVMRNHLDPMRMHAIASHYPYPFAGGMPMLPDFRLQPVDPTNPQHGFRPRDDPLASTDGSFAAAKLGPGQHMRQSTHRCCIERARAVKREVPSKETFKEALLQMEQERVVKLMRTQDTDIGIQGIWLVEV